MWPRNHKICISNVAERARGCIFGRGLRLTSATRLHGWCDAVPMISSINTNVCVYLWFSRFAIVCLLRITTNYNYGQVLLCSSECDCSSVSLWRVSLRILYIKRIFTHLISVQAVLALLVAVSVAKPADNSAVEETDTDDLQTAQQFHRGFGFGGGFGA